MKQVEKILSFRSFKEVLAGVGIYGDASTYYGCYIAADGDPYKMSKGVVAFHINSDTEYSMVLIQELLIKLNLINHFGIKEKFQLN